jgi:hypothetical protein
MTGSATWLRVSALLTAGAFGVHQLRYLLAYGEASGPALEHSGHGYLTAVEPLIVLVLGGALAHVVWRVVAGRPGAALPSRPRLAALLTLALLVVYTAQELVEGRLAPGHGGVVAHGGWVALPLAVLFGVALALVLRATEDAGGDVRLRAPLARIVTAGPPQARPPQCVAAATASPLATHLAGRAPPPLLSP